MNESNVMRLIELALGKLPNVKIFRNNTGIGWVGQSQRINGSGNVMVKDARPLHAGLCEGSSDLIGWTEITIQPHMIGKKVAVFTALEVKRDSFARVSPKQRNFLEVVTKSGGIAGIVHSPEGAKDIIDFHGK